MSQFRITTEPIAATDTEPHCWRAVVWEINGNKWKKIIEVVHRRAGYARMTAAKEWKERIGLMRYLRVTDAD